MKLKNKKTLLLIPIISAFVFAVQNIAFAATAGMKYKLLESLPGFYSAGSTMTDLPALILAIYKFGIWTVGIAGLFMLVIGGFWYMSSAGNTATASSAKGIIWDSIIGIIAALAAYLIMYVINPDLIKINIAFTPVEIAATEGTPMGTAGQCSTIPNGDCSVTTLAAANTTNNAQWGTQASAICNGESRGANIPTTVDMCKGNGRTDPVSIGLFQINLSAHNLPGYPNLDCIHAFNMRYTGASMASQCFVTDLTTYNACVAAALVPATNIAAALEVYKSAGSTWQPWGANRRSSCNFP